MERFPGLQFLRRQDAVVDEPLDAGVQPLPVVAPPQVVQRVDGLGEGVINASLVRKRSRSVRSDSPLLPDQGLGST